MEKSKQKEIGIRLKNLREEAKLSQKELAEVLKNRDILKTALDGETGGHTISQIERAVRGLTIDMALEYTKIFNVSLDYIYGESNNLKPEYNEIIEKIGLSDKAIKNLEEINNNNKIAISVLNYLLSTKPELFNLFLTMLNKYAIFYKNKKPHKIIIEKNSFLFSICQQEEIDVVSLHGIVIPRVPEKLLVSAKSADGVIEALEYHEEDNKILGVQFHPEIEEYSNIFSWLVETSKENALKRTRN